MAGPSNGLGWSTFAPSARTELTDRAEPALPTRLDWGAICALAASWLEGWQASRSRMNGHHRRTMHKT